MSIKSNNFSKTVKAFFTAGLFVLVMISVSCNSGNSSENSQSGGGGSSGGGTAQSSENPYAVSEDSRTQNLDFIFNPDVLGKTTITISRSEWNTLLKYYDWNKNNETSVHADYTFEKNGKKWSFKNAGLRLRGNTSRVRPQTTDGKYIQAHFKIDFEEWITDGSEVKMSGCLKSINLKRFRHDGYYAGEIFSYNFFRNNGIWTAPRASYTQLFINITDSSSSESVDFGIYGMVESIDKQYLKERTTKQGGGKLSDNKGNLWKCTWGGGNGADLQNNRGTFGVESKEFTDLSNSQNGGYKSQTYDYDLKTNKDNLSTASSDFKTWISSLNSLSSSDAKTWYDSKMNADLFIKTYAVNVVLGMWDDYWTNKNNYYLYFDTDGKSYFIPYDYDNVLGITQSECNADPVNRNPLEWGYCNCSKGERPLIEKLLLVPEYKKLYSDYLVSLTASDWYSGAVEKISGWQKMFSSLVPAADVSYSNDTSSTVKDGSGLSSYFTNKKSVIARYCSGEEESAPDGAVAPAVYDSSSDKMTFTFMPAYYTAVSSDSAVSTYSIYVRSDLTGWANSDAYKMTYDSVSGNFVLEKSDWKSLKSSPFEFKFYINDLKKWQGYNDVTSGYKTLCTGSDNFQIVY